MSVSAITSTYLFTLAETGKKYKRVKTLLQVVSLVMFTAIAYYYYLLFFLAKI